MPDPLDKIRRPRTRAPGTSGPAKKVTDGGAGSLSEINGSPEAQFREILDTVSGGEVEKRLKTILNDIRTLSDILSRRRLLEDLEDYRAKVGEFLRVYLDEVLDVRQAAGRRGFSKRRQLLVVKRVNVELEELSRLVLGGAPDFKIFSELGTIKGLLMDLYR